MAKKTFGRKTFGKILSTFFNRDGIQLSKLLIFGMLVILLNYGVFFALYRFVAFNYIISSIIGYIAGVLLGFLLIKSSFFRSKSIFEFDSKEYQPEVLKYFIVYFCSMFLGLGVLIALTEFFHMTPLIANIFSIGLAGVTNLIGRRLFVFNESKRRDINFLVYRYRFLINYIIIGFCSILVELSIIMLLQSRIHINVIYLSIFGFICGVLFSYYLNSRLNFKVPKDKNFRTFRIFVAISTMSYGLNILLYKIIGGFINYEYYYLRFVTAAIVFVISYTLHRRFTFVDVKYVGIAMYLTKKENIEKVWEKIKDYPDFIHIDIIDNTFISDAPAIDLSKGYELRKRWIGVNTMAHIMSKNPMEYIDKVADFADTIIVHIDIDENVDDVIDKIIGLGKTPGICLSYKTDINACKKYFNKVKIVQILGIKHPGMSGQNLEKDALKKLDQLNRLKSKYHFEVCFDGGVKRENINQINAKYIISASSVLSSDNPIDVIFDLKTSSSYYAREMSLKNNIKNKVLHITKSMPFVKSLNIVGSFVDKDDVRGMSDIDIIIIVDKLDKKKYDMLLTEFSALKKIIEVDYNLKAKINDTFGPLKFDDLYDVVFHVMIYDVEGHLKHCIDSPFTVLDWERTNVFAHTHMSNIVSTFIPQPNQLINSRRSVESYSKDLKEKSITYRKYVFGNDGVREIKLKKEFRDKERVEYIYHVTKFLIINFMKVHKRKNLVFSKELLDEFFDITNVNHNHLSFFKDINNRKSKKKIYLKREDIAKLKSFLAEYKNAYDTMFVKGVRKITFLRHQKTPMNIEGVFFGQRHDISIDPILDEKILSSLRDIVNDVDFIYSSSLKRAIETAGAVNSEAKKEIIINSALNELDYGLADGKDYGYLKKNHPDLIKAWAERKDPRFPEGENYADLIARLDKFFATLKSKDFHKALVVTHNVLLRVVIGRILGIPKHLWFKIHVGNLEHFEVILANNGNMYLDASPEFLRKIYMDVYTK